LPGHCHGGVREGDRLRRRHTSPHCLARVVREALAGRDRREVLMSRIKTAIASTLLLTMCGCAGGYYVNSLQGLKDVTSGLQGNSAKIVLSNGRELTARARALTDSTLRWERVGTGKRESAHVSEISSIERRKPLRGMGSGLLYGSVAGLLIGFQMTEDDAKGEDSTRQYAWILGTTGVVGGLGMIAGLLFDSDTYTIDLPLSPRAVPDTSGAAAKSARDSVAPGD
jgi:hypothetical protein